MSPVKIKDDVYWVGGIDWDLRNFHGYLTQKGSTYNAGIACMGFNNSFNKRFVTRLQDYPTIHYTSITNHW